MQEEQLYSECGARENYFCLSTLLSICPPLFENYLNEANYIIYEKLSRVFCVAGFRSVRSE